jgi:hypothetical protein
MIYQSVGGHLRQNKESYVFLFKVYDVFQDKFSIKLSKINPDRSLIYKKSNELQAIDGHWIWNCLFRN